MFVDPNQINPYDKVLAGPNMNGEYNDIINTWILLRSVIRKQKIEKIYGENSNRKEKF